MKSKIMQIVIVCTLLVGLIIAGCAAPAPAPSPAPSPAPAPAPAPKPTVLKTLKFHIMFSDKSMEYNQIFNKWAQDVEKATNGQVKFEFYLSSALGPPPGSWERVTTGVTDVEWIIPEYTPGLFPLTSVLNLPFLGLPFSTDVCAHVMFDLYNKFPEIQKESSAAKMLFVGTTTPAGFYTSKKPIKTLPDFKGLKLRAAGELVSKMIESLGASPVAMPVPDVFLAVEKGTVDGICMSPGAFRALKLMDVLNHYTVVASQATPMWVVMNWDAWNSLSPEVQKTIDDISPGYWKVVGAAFDAEWDAAFKVIKERKQDVIYPSDAEVAKWRDVCKWEWDEWVKTLSAKGLPAQAVLDETLNLIKKYK